MEEINGQDIRVILSLKQGKPLLLKICSHRIWQSCVWTITAVKEKHTTFQTKLLSFFFVGHSAPISCLSCDVRIFRRVYESDHSVTLYPFFLSGRNFGHLNVTPSDGIFIEATLNGAILDTDVVPITEKPIFDSELMWELDKKMLKR